MNASRPENGRRPLPRGADRPVSRRGEDWLRTSLQRIYIDDAAEPVPDEWLRLLGRLDAQGPGDV